MNSHCSFFVFLLFAFSYFTQSIYASSKVFAYDIPESAFGGDFSLHEELENAKISNDEFIASLSRKEIAGNIIGYKKRCLVLEMLRKLLDFIDKDDIERRSLCIYPYIPFVFSFVEGESGQCHFNESEFLLVCIRKSEARILVFSPKRIEGWDNLSIYASSKVFAYDIPESAFGGDFSLHEELENAKISNDEFIASLSRKEIAGNIIGYKKRCLVLEMLRKLLDFIDKDDIEQRSLCIYPYIPIIFSFVEGESGQCHFNESEFLLVCIRKSEARILVFSPKRIEGWDNLSIYASSKV